MGCSKELSVQSVTRLKVMAIHRNKASRQNVATNRRRQRRVGESTILLMDAEHSVQLWCPICQNLRVC